MQEQRSPDRVTPEILVVDDDRDLREGIVEALSDQPCSICLADSGAAALERLRRPPPVVLMLLDLRMPRMSGIELLERIESDPSLPRVPTWLMSHDDEVAARVKGHRITGILDKPLRLDALVAVLRTVI